MLTLSPRNHPGRELNRERARLGPTPAELMREHWRGEQVFADADAPGADVPPGGDARDRLMQSVTWRRRRAAVLVRARHRCGECGAQAHEVIGASGAFAPSAPEAALIAVCDRCRERREGGPLAGVLTNLLGALRTAEARSA